MKDYVSRPAAHARAASLCTGDPAGQATANTPNSRLSPLLVVAEMISFQCGAGAAKEVFGVASPLLLAAMRIGFSAIVITLLVRPSIKELTRRQWCSVTALGITISTMNVSYFYTISFLPLGIATGLELLGPLVVAAMWARGPRQWIAVVLALTGTIWLTGPSGSLSLLGVGIGLVASALRGVYVVLNRRVGSAVPGWSGLSLSLSIGAVLVIPLTIAFEGSRLKTGYDVVGYGFMVSIFSSLVPYSLDFAALRRISVHTFSILLALSPVIGALAGLIMLGEHQTLSQWIAMLVVVTAGLLASGRRVTPPPASDSQEQTCYPIYLPPAAANTTLLNPDRPPAPYEKS